MPKRNSFAPSRVGLPPGALDTLARQGAKGGGEGRTRTFEAARATDLQSAAFDRFATSPIVCSDVVSSVPAELPVDGAGEGIRTPDLLITNQLLYRPELRQPDKRGTIALRVPAVQAPTRCCTAPRHVKCRIHACLDAAARLRITRPPWQPRRSGFEHAPASGSKPASHT